jgi:hypothetical protein
MRRQDKMPARNKKNFRPTEKGAGMTRAGVAAYRRKNPGSKLKTAVTGKVKKNFLKQQRILILDYVRLEEDGSARQINL